MDARDAAWEGGMVPSNQSGSEALSKALTNRNNALSRGNPMGAVWHLVAGKKARLLAERLPSLGHDALNVLSYWYLSTVLPTDAMTIGEATWLGLTAAEEAYERGSAKPHQLALAYAARARWVGRHGRRLSEKMREHLRELTQLILELEDAIRSERDQPQGLRQLVRALKHLSVAHGDVGKRQASYAYACRALVLAEGAANTESQARQLRKLVRKYEQ